MTYSPNCGFTDNEKQALEKLKNDHGLKSALRKVFADNSAGVIFELMNYVHGTAETEENLGDWTEIAFVDRTEEIEPPNDVLHDNFYSSYWDWKEIRPDSDWTIDMNETE